MSISQYNKSRKFTFSIPESVEFTPMYKLVNKKITLRLLFTANTKYGVAPCLAGLDESNNIVLFSAPRFYVDTITEMLNDPSTIEQINDGNAFVTVIEVYIPKLQKCVYRLQFSDK